MSVPAVSPPLAGSRPETRTVGVARGQSGLLHLDLSRTGYLAAASLIIVAYLAVWLTHFSTVYGWVNDDYYLYTKGMLTIQNWQQAFLYHYNALQAYGLVMDDYYSFAKGLATVRDWRAGFAAPSIEQAYFFVISYLPLWSGI